MDLEGSWLGHDPGVWGWPLIQGEYRSSLGSVHSRSSVTPQISRHGSLVHDQDMSCGERCPAALMCHRGYMAIFHIVVNERSDFKCSLKCFLKKEKPHTSLCMSCFPRRIHSEPCNFPLAFSQPAADLRAGGAPDV